MPVPTWEIVIPLLALVVLGYTLYRNVFPYPTAGPAQWFPVVAFGWIALVAWSRCWSPGLRATARGGLGELDARPSESEVVRG